MVRSRHHMTWQPCGNKFIALTQGRLQCLMVAIRLPCEKILVQKIIKETGFKNEKMRMV